MLGMVQKQLGGPCGCYRVNRMEKNVSQAERGREGCSETHGTLEDIEDLVLRWETTRRWRQKGLKSQISSNRPMLSTGSARPLLSMGSVRPVLSTGSASDRKQRQEWEEGLELLQRQQNYIRVELGRGEGLPVPYVPHPTGFIHRLGMRNEKGRLALTSRRTACRECKHTCIKCSLRSSSHSCPLG